MASHCLPALPLILTSRTSPTGAPLLTAHHSSLLNSCSRRCVRPSATSNIYSGSCKPKITSGLAMTQSSVALRRCTRRSMLSMLRQPGGRHSAYGTCIYIPSLFVHVLSGIFRWIGQLTPNSPSWKREPHVVHTRDTLALLKSIISNREFDGKWSCLMLASRRS